MPKAWKTRRLPRFNDSLGVPVFVRLERATGRLLFRSLTGRHLALSLEQVWNWQMTPRRMVEHLEEVRRSVLRLQETAAAGIEGERTGEGTYVRRRKTRQPAGGQSPALRDQPAQVVS